MSRIAKEQLKQFKAYFKNFHARYGVLGAASVAAVFSKIALFYFFIGPKFYAPLVFTVTCFLILLLFASFRNKWVPAAIFAALSVLMLCDVLYASYFAALLSVNLIAAAAFLGSVTASVAEVFRPSFLLLLADAALIFLCLIRTRGKRKPIEGREEGPAESNEKKPILKRCETYAKTAAVLIIALLAVNITESDWVTSVSNQEIITYHVKDIARGVSAETAGGIDTGPAPEDDFPLFTNAYEAEKRGPLFGIAEGRNLIVVQLESVQNFVVGLVYNGQEITPNLNKLLDENTAYFDNYYQQINTGNTSDAEFASNNSIYGSLRSYTYRIYAGRNYFRGLPALLKEKGYETAVFHAYENKNFWNRQTAYPHLGFDTFYGGLNDKASGGVYKPDEMIGLGLSDESFYAQTARLMSELREPFYSFVISLSNHHPYTMPEQHQFIELLPRDRGTLVGDYLNSVAYTDYALGKFLDALKAKGWYDSSIIAVYGDHMGLARSPAVDVSMRQLLGHAYDYDAMLNIPLLITVPDAGQELRQTISVAGGHLDFFPTIAYLMGLDKLDTLYLGHNLFAVKEGLVIQQTYMPRGSFFTNDIAYEMSNDRIFKNGRAWNLKTREEVPLSECYDDYVRAMEIIQSADNILKSDAIRRVFLEGEAAVTAFRSDFKREYPDRIAIAGAPDGPYGSSVEEIRYSYYNAGKYVRIELNWTEESEPVALDPHTGQIEMTHEELADWMERNPGATVFVNIERSGDYFMRFMTAYSRDAAERMVLELPQLFEYTGNYEAMINLSAIERTDSEVKDFIEKNNVWAILMTKEDSEGRFKSLMSLDTAIYIMGEEEGFIIKVN